MSYRGTKYHATIDNKFLNYYGFRVCDRHEDVIGIGNYIMYSKCLDKTLGNRRKKEINNRPRNREELSKSDNFFYAVVVCVSYVPAITIHWLRIGE